MGLSEQGIFKLVIGYLRTLGLTAIAKIFLLLASVTLASSLSPLIFSKIFELDKTDPVNPSTSVMAVIGAYLSLRITAAILYELRWIVINPTLYKMSYNFGLQIADEISSTHEANTSENLTIAQTAKVTSLVQNAQNAFMNSGYNILSILIPTFFEVLFILIVISLSVGLIGFVISLFGLILSILLLEWGRRKEASALREASDKDLDVYSAVGQFVSNVQIVNQFGGRKYFLEKVDTAISESIVLHWSFFVRKCLNGVVRSASIILTYALVMIVAAIQFQAIDSSVANLFLIFAYLERISGPISTLSGAIVSMRNSQTTFELVDNYIKEVTNSNGEVFFELQSNKEEILNAVRNRLHASSPKVFQILGKSGVGKSTFFRYLKSQLAISEALPIKICYLSSTVPLVKGSGEENILFFCATEQKEILSRFLISQSNDANFDLNRIVAVDDVEQLSGGERQFLSVLRLLVQCPDVAILDEAMSAMDSELETFALRAIRYQLPNTVILLASHRSTVPIHVDVKFVVSRPSFI